MAHQRRPGSPSRLLASVVLGAPLPLAFLGSSLIQTDGARTGPAHWDLAVFHIVAPALLFAMLAFAVWTLMRQRRAL
jgi:hypothetical protein